MNKKRSELEQKLKKLESIVKPKKIKYKISRKLMNEINFELGDLFEIDALKKHGFDIDTDSSTPPEQWSEKDSEFINNMWSLHARISSMIEEKLKKE